MQTLIERLQHFEKHQLEAGDTYGAEVLHEAIVAVGKLVEHEKLVSVQQEKLVEVQSKLSSVAADVDAIEVAARALAVYGASGPLLKILERCDELAERLGDKIK